MNFFKNLQNLGKYSRGTVTKLSAEEVKANNISASIVQGEFRKQVQFFIGATGEKYRLDVTEGSVCPPVGSEVDPTQVAQVELVRAGSPTLHRAEFEEAAPKAE